MSTQFNVTIESHAPSNGPHASARTSIAGRSLKELIRLTKKTEFQKFIRDIEDGNYQWKPLNDDLNNLGQINITSDPIMGLLENDSNAKDAVVQKLIDKGYGINATSGCEVIEDFLQGEDQDQKLSSSDNPWVSMIFQAQDEYYLLDEGRKRPCVTIDIVDQGCGIAYDMVDQTILRFHARSKTRDPRMIGKYGQGGSTALAHVAREGGSMYFTCHHKNPELVTVCVIRCMDIDDYRIPVYMYLADTDGKPIVLLNDGSVKAGTTIRHFGYKLDNRELLFYASARRHKASFYTTLNEHMVDPIIKTRIYDNRDLGKRNITARMKRRTTMGSGELISGSLPRIRNGATRTSKGQTEKDIVYLAPETRFPMGYDQNGNDRGFITIQSAVTGHLRKRDGETMMYIYNFVNAGSSGKVHLSGQAICDIRTSDILANTNFPFLKNYLCVYICLDGLSPSTLASGVQANRASLTPGLLNLIHERLYTVLNGDEQLAYWNEERKKIGHTGSTHEGVAERLRKEFRLLFSGAPRKPRRPSPPPEPVMLQEPPTFLRILTPDPKPTYLGKEFCLNFITDAPPSYLKWPGNLEVRSLQGSIDVSNADPNTNRGSIPGYGILRGLKPHDNANIGDEDVLLITLKNNEKTVSQAYITMKVSQDPANSPIKKLSMGDVDILPVDREAGAIWGLTDPERHIATYCKNVNTQKLEIRVATFSQEYQQMQEHVRKDGRGAPDEDTLVRLQEYAHREYLYYISREILRYYIETGMVVPELSEPVEEDETPLLTLTPFEQRVKGTASACSDFLSSNAKYTYNK
jgi:hypothetical protein